MTRLILSTSNIVNGGPSIIRKTGANRSNIELTNSLQANFVAAQEDFSPSASANTTPSPVEDGAKPERPPVSTWTERHGNDWYVPKIDWSMSGLSEEPSQYDITVKLFYLPSASASASASERAQHARDALSLVRKELGVPSINLLIVSFPGMSFEGDCEWEADKKNSGQGDDEEEILTWPVLEQLREEGLVKRLGLADFGSEKLSRFLTRVRHRPEVDQINLKDCCNVPPPLVELAKREGIELLTHSDCTDILPRGTLRDLLGQGPNGAGVLSETKRGIDGMKGDVKPTWVAKYTAIVRDRGVIESKGYFASADLAE